MKQIKRRNFVGQVAGLAGLAGLGGAMALTSKDAGAQSVSLSQFSTTVAGTVAGVGATGTMVISHFSSKSGQILASGIATLTDVNGQVTKFPFSTLPVSVARATCEILELTLGPLDLNLLGLVIHLDRVNLLIVANPAGGLLGQLLCAIANLLSGGLQNALQQLVNLLNQLLTVLR